MSNKLCYVVMRLIDLGGQSVSVYFNKQAAKIQTDLLNAEYETETVTRLINDSKFSSERANEFIQTRDKEFYIECVPLNT